METKQTPETKWIDFAYPSSPSAVEHGFGDTGCWVLKVGHLFGESRPLGAVMTKQGALKWAAMFSARWNPYWLECEHARALIDNDALSYATT